jgi:hypothetical protein
MGPRLLPVIVGRAEVARRRLRLGRQHAPKAQVMFDTVDLH